MFLLIAFLITTTYLVYARMIKNDKLRKCNFRRLYNFATAAYLVYLKAIYILYKAEFVQVAFFSARRVLCVRKGD